MVLRYERDGVRVKKTIDVDRVPGRRGIVRVSVNRRKLRQPDGKAARHFEDDGLLKWEGFLELFSASLKEIVTREALRDRKDD